MPCLSLGRSLALLIVLAEAGSGKKLLEDGEFPPTKANARVFTATTDSERFVVRLVEQEQKAPRENRERAANKVLESIVKREVIMSKGMGNRMPRRTQRREQDSLSLDKRYIKILKERQYFSVRGDFIP